VIEAGGLDPDQSVAHFQRSQFLDTDLNDLRTAGAERASDTPLSTGSHGLTPYHPTSSNAQCEVHRDYAHALSCQLRVGPMALITRD